MFNMPTNRYMLMHWKCKLKKVVSYHDCVAPARMMTSHGWAGTLMGGSILKPLCQTGIWCVSAQRWMLSEYM